MQGAKLRLQSVTKRFGEGDNILVALDQISFDVADRAIVAIVGPSGCGKTTLLRMCAGLDHPTSGEILVNDKLVGRPSRERGMVFQNYSSFPWLNVLQNVEFGLRYRPNVSRRERNSLAQHFIDLVGLGGFEGKYIAQLSGGMQQRLAIARTLAADPDILLMDEPFGALDTENRELLQVQLLRIQELTEKTILLVTHDIDEAVYLADEIVVLSARPATLRTRIKIPFRNPRTLDIKSSAEFIEIRKEVFSFIRREAAQSSVGESDTGMVTLQRPGRYRFR